MTSEAFLARQPIVDGEHKLLGYELLFRQSQQASQADVGDSLSATLHVIANTLYDMGTKWLLQGKVAFINMEHDLLMSEFISLLPNDKIIIEIMEGVEATPELLARLNELKAAGFRFALDKFRVRPGIEKLLPYASYIKIDQLTQTPEQTAALVKKLERAPVKLIAERVESQENFKHCKELGFHYFQGYYFAHPEHLVAKVMNPAHVTVLQLMDKVRQEADLKEIEICLNSPGGEYSALVHYVWHLESWRRKGIVVKTTGLVNVASAAAMMLSLGDLGHRRVYPHTELVYHFARLGEVHHLTASKAKYLQESLQKVDDKMLEQLVKHLVPQVRGQCFPRQDSQVNRTRFKAKLCKTETEAKQKIRSDLERLFNLDRPIHAEQAYAFYLVD
jgi:EAL domain-containing protein (putative c-di-GMP-specific phosphodiesterase class I)